MRRQVRIKRIHHLAFKAAGVTAVRNRVNCNRTEHVLRTVITDSDPARAAHELDTGQDHISWSEPAGDRFVIDWKRLGSREVAMNVTK